MLSSLTDLLPSMRSVKNFFLTNALLFAFAAGEYVAVEQCVLLPCLAAVSIVKNVAMMKNIEHFVKDKPWIGGDTRKVPSPAYRGEFWFNLIRTSLVESFTKFVVYNYVVRAGAVEYWRDLLLFVPYSLAFEIIFDFFHYWSHRLLHIYPFLYRNVHKHHHKFPYPTPIIAFYQSPIDLLLTNTLPSLAALFLLPSASKWLVCLLFTYKTHTEISGHTGRDIPSTPSFPQCIWIPRVLKFALHTEDHDLHHSLNNCNYSKRFAIWDKLFGTFKQRSVENEQER